MGCVEERDEACHLNSECASGNCDHRKCSPTGVGGTCVERKDCSSERCNENTCVAAGVGGTCAESTDCSSGRCNEKTCVAVSGLIPKIASALVGFGLGAA